MKTTSLTIRLAPESKAKLTAICQMEHRSQSQQIEYWIDSYKLMERMKFKHKFFGKINYKDKTLVLTQNPYVDLSGRYGIGSPKEDAWYARAVDQEGNEYHIMWEETDYYKTADREFQLENQDHACHWDTPVHVESL